MTWTQAFNQQLSPNEYFLPPQQIQQLPWESIPILRDGAVCRMPSLYFILAQLLRSPGAPVADGLDPTDAFFVLNPSNDLANTQKTFQKWFEK